MIGFKYLSGTFNECTVGLIKHLAEQGIDDVQVQEQDGLTYFSIGKDSASFPTWDYFYFHRVVKLSQDGLSISVSYRAPSVNFQSEVEEKLMKLVREHMKIPEESDQITLEQKLIKPEVPAWCSKDSSSKIITSKEYETMVSVLQRATANEQSITIEI